MTRASTVAFVPRNRLSSILTSPDGKSFADHVGRAEEAVQAIAPALTEGIGVDVRALVWLCRQAEGDTFGQCREIGWLALKIVESARLAGRPALAEIAQGVWEMIDALSGRGIWHTDALRLHSDALAVMLIEEGKGLDGLSLTRQLARLREAIGVGTTPVTADQNSDV